MKVSDKRRSRDLRQVLAVIAVALAVAAAGCTGRLVSRAVEDGIRDRLPDLIGPADSYAVEVHGSTRRMLRGRIGEIVVRGKGVWVSPDMCLDSIEVRMKDVSADPESLALKDVGEITFEAVASERSVNDYLALSRADEVEVELREGMVVAKARPKVLSVPAEVRLIGRLVARGEKLDLRVDRLQVAGLSAPLTAARAFEDRINPVVELELAGFVPELRSATILPGAVRIAGTARLAGSIDRTNRGRQLPKNDHAGHPAR